MTPDAIIPHIPAMRRFASRYVRMDEVEDLVQDALLRALLDWNKFDSKQGYIRTWLYFRVRWAFWKRNETNKIRQEVIRKTGIQIQTTVPPSQEDHVLLKELPLSPVLQAFINGVKVEDLAKQLYILPNSIHVRISKERKELRRLLDERKIA